MTSSRILDGGWPAPQCWTGIWRWWITVLFSSIVLSILSLFSVLFCVCGIATGNETDSPYDVLVSSLAPCVTIVSDLNLSPMIPLTKALLLVITEALNVFSNGHEKMLLHATPYPRSRETVTGFPFTTKEFL